jgi:hypothetical protein
VGAVSQSQIKQQLFSQTAINWQPVARQDEAINFFREPISAHLHLSSARVGRKWKGLHFFQKKMSAFFSRNIINLKQTRTDSSNRDDRPPLDSAVDN